MSPSNQNVTMATTNLRCDIIGSCESDVTIQGKTYKNIKLGVLRDLCCDLLLGCDFQSRNQQVTFKYDGTEVNLVSKNFNEDFCSTTISNIEPVALFTNLLSGYKPIATKSRRHNSWDQEFIDAEIQRLVKSGIIRPSNSPWRAQILVIRNKESQKRRLCIDYSQTINLYTLLDAYPLPKIETLVQQLSKYKLFSTFDLKAAYHQIPI